MSDLDVINLIYTAIELADDGGQVHSVMTNITQ